MRPITNPKNKQPFPALSNQVPRKVFQNSDIIIVTGHVGVTMLNWEARNNNHPKGAI